MVGLGQQHGKTDVQIGLRTLGTAGVAQCLEDTCRFRLLAEALVGIGKGHALLGVRAQCLVQALQECIRAIDSPPLEVEVEEKEQCRGRGLGFATRGFGKRLAQFVESQLRNRRSCCHLPRWCTRLVAPRSPQRHGALPIRLREPMPRQPDAPLDALRLLSDQRLVGLDQDRLLALLAAHLQQLAAHLEGERVCGSRAEEPDGFIDATAFAQQIDPRTSLVLTQFGCLCEAIQQGIDTALLAVGLEEQSQREASITPQARAAHSPPCSVARRLYVISSQGPCRVPHQATPSHPLACARPRRTQQDRLLGTAQKRQHHGHALGKPRLGGKEFAEGWNGIVSRGERGLGQPEEERSLSRVPGKGDGMRRGGNRPIRGQGFLRLAAHVQDLRVQQLPFAAAGILQQGGRVVEIATTEQARGERVSRTLVMRCIELLVGQARTQVHDKGLDPAVRNRGVAEQRVGARPGSLPADQGINSGDQSGIQSRGRLVLLRRER